jgi:hypothetical protein
MTDIKTFLRTTNSIIPLSPHPGDCESGGAVSACSAEAAPRIPLERAAISAAPAAHCPIGIARIHLPVGAGFGFGQGPKASPL